MAITSTQSKAPGSVSNIATGSYLDTGTVAAFSITCGFKPRYVRVLNQTSGDEVEWFYGMTAAHGTKRQAAGTWVNLTSNGITVTEHGFTVGLDTDICYTSEQLRWLALG